MQVLQEQKPVSRGNSTTHNSTRKQSIFWGRVKITFQVCVLVTNCQLLKITNPVFTPGLLFLNFDTSQLRFQLGARTKSTTWMPTSTAQSATCWRRLRLAMGLTYYYLLSRSSWFSVFQYGYKLITSLGAIYNIRNNHTNSFLIEIKKAKDCRFWLFLVFRLVTLRCAGTYFPHTSVGYNNGRYVRCCVHSHCVRYSDCTVGL